MDRRLWALATVVQTLLVAVVVVLVAVPRGIAAPGAQPTGQAGGRPSGRIDVATSISLEEARVIIDAAVANARAAGGHPVIVVVDDRGDVVSMDRVDGTTDYFARFAIGKAKGAVALQQPTGETADSYEAVHPLVRTIDETGQKAIYCSKVHTTCFEGMTDEESRPLIDWLVSHATRPEFTCRVSWQPGTLTIWDNRRVMHNAINDYHGMRRHMRRLTSGPTVPV